MKLLYRVSKPHVKGSVLIPLLVLLTLIGQKSEAQTLPDATFSGAVGTGGGVSTLSTPGTVTYNYLSADSPTEELSGHAIISGGLDATLDVSATFAGAWDEGISPVGIGSMAQESFYYEILGPVGQNVPIFYDATAQTATSVPLINGGEGGQAIAQFNTYSVGEGVSWTGPNLVAATDPSIAAGDPPTYFTLAQNYMVPTDTTIIVSLEVNAGVDEYDGTASAQIDPLISIDPTFASQNPGYSLAFSGNLTPEPSTWALLLCGIGVLAFWRECSRRCGKGDRHLFGGKEYVRFVS